MVATRRSGSGGRETADSKRQDWQTRAQQTWESVRRRMPQSKEEAVQTLSNAAASVSATASDLYQRMPQVGRFTLFSQRQKVAGHFHGETATKHLKDLFDKNVEIAVSELKDGHDNVPNLVKDSCNAYLKSLIEARNQWDAKLRNEYFGDITDNRILGIRVGKDSAVGGLAAAAGTAAYNFVSTAWCWTTHMFDQDEKACEESGAGPIVAGVVMLSVAGAAGAKAYTDFQSEKTEIKARIDELDRRIGKVVDAHNHADIGLNDDNVTVLNSLGHQLTQYNSATASL